MSRKFPEKVLWNKEIASLKTLYGRTVVGEIPCNICSENPKFGYAAYKTKDNIYYLCRNCASKYKTEKVELLEDLEFPEKVSNTGRFYAFRTMTKQADRPCLICNKFNSTGYGEYQSQNNRLGSYIFCHKCAVEREMEEFENKTADYPKELSIENKINPTGKVEPSPENERGPIRYNPSKEEIKIKLLERKVIDLKKQLMMSDATIDGLRGVIGQLYLKEDSGNEGESQ